ncbi:potassium-transporting ATPase subunit C, partial [Pseudomonas sp. Pseusp97]|uniref:potassium-transporting ATPase subunit C n=1 Tax=Pseudomonas sp. Pseusp97 TaxID=3243065 RepID=UPI0039A64C4B
MLNQLRPAVASLVLLSAITGIAYPLVVTGIAQVAFHDQANGSLVRDDQGNVRGSALIAQKFDGAQWFHPRPSAGDYATVSSSASNLAPGNPALAERIAKDAAAQQIGAQPVPLPE